MIDETIKINFASEEIDWQIENNPIRSNNNAEWLWALAIVSFAVIIFSVLLKNYLLIIIVFLSAFIVYISKNRKPELHHFRIDNEGLHIDGKFYNYENFDSFWIFPAQFDSQKELAFRYNRSIMPLLIVPFHNSDESAIKKILENHLLEMEEKESFLDLLQKRFF